MMEMATSSANDLAAETERHGNALVEEPWQAPYRCGLRLDNVTFTTLRRSLVLEHCKWVQDGCPSPAEVVPPLSRARKVRQPLWKWDPGGPAVTLEAGARAYGDKSFSRDPIELLDEIRQELRDVCGWAFILDARLERMRRALVGPGRGEGTAP